MNCRFSEEELSAFVDGEVERGRATAIEAHLRQCERCRATVAGLRSLVAALARPRDVDLGVRTRIGVARRLALSEPWPDFACARAQTWISADLDAELPAEQARLLHDHLERCPACAAEGMALRALSRSVKALLEVAPPLSLERSVRVAIGRRQRGLIPRWLAGGLQGPRLAPGLAPVAAAATLIIGFWMGRQFPGETVSPPVRSSVTAPMIPAHEQVAANGEARRTVPAVKRARAIARKPRADVVAAIHREDGQEILRHIPAPLPRPAPRKPGYFTAPQLATVTPVVTPVDVPAPVPTVPTAGPPPPAPSAIAVDAPQPPPAVTEPPVKRAPAPVRIALSDPDAGSEPDTSASRRAKLWEMGQPDDLEMAAAALGGKPLFRGPQRTLLIVKFQ